VNCMPFGLLMVPCVPRVMSLTSEIRVPWFTQKLKLMWTWGHSSLHSQLSQKAWPDQAVCVQSIKFTSLQPCAGEIIRYHYPSRSTRGVQVWLQGIGNIEAPRIHGVVRKDHDRCSGSRGWYERSEGKIMVRWEGEKKERILIQD